MIVLSQIKINARKIYNNDKETLIKEHICRLFKITLESILDFKILKEYNLTKRMVHYGRKKKV